MSQAVFDIECNNLIPELVTKVWCLVIKDLETNEIFKYGPDSIEVGVRRLGTYNLLIGHNVISYDLPVLSYLFSFHPIPETIDTLILSRLLNPDRIVPFGWKGTWEPHSLKAWGMRLDMPKVEWNKWDVWDEGMLHRCEQDVLINEKLYKVLYEELKE